MQPADRDGGRKRKITLSTRTHAHTHALTQGVGAARVHHACLPLARLEVDARVIVDRVAGAEDAHVGEGRGGRCWRGVRVCEFA